jgi:hypothetical protein
MLTESTCLCLFFGTIFLILTFKRIFSSSRPTTSAQVLSPVSSVQPPESSLSPSYPSATEPAPTPEDERERLEEHFENIYLQDWLKEFEEEEVARRFRERYFEEQQLLGLKMEMEQVQLREGFGGMMYNRKYQRMRGY